MNDIAIVKLFLKKENYVKYTHTVATIKTEVEITKLLIAIGLYYEKYDHHEYIAIDELREFFYLVNPSERNNPNYGRIFEEIGSIEISDSLAASLVTQYLEKDAASKIIELLAPVLNGDTSDVILSVSECVQEYRDKARLVDEEDSLYIEHDASDIVDLLDRSGGLHWSVRCLDDNLWPLPGGTLGHVFARVEAGKTAFCTDTIGAWLNQVEGDEKVFWFSNEEGRKFILQRAIQRVCGWSREELAAVVASRGVGYVNDRFAEEGGRNLIMVHDDNLSIELIQSILDRFARPRAAVIDIADHVTFRGCTDLATPTRLGELYRRYRRMATVYEMDVLTAGQAHAEAEGRRRVNMDHMHNSKTDKPGALDYAIGIGKEQVENNLRYLNLPKNKLGQTQRDIHTVRFEIPHIRFKDVG